MTNNCDGYQPDRHASVKRLAWAFGCAKKDSVEESALYRLLVERMRQTSRKLQEEG